jgi:hypothetical protein
VTRRRRERGKPRRTAPPTSAGARPRRRPALLSLLVLIALGLAVLAVWKLGRREAPAARRSPIADLPPGAAAQRAAELLGEKRYVASLPYLRRAIEETPEDPGAHVHYAVALLNAVHETRTHLGHDEFAVRGSPERVAMVREALDHLIQVERMSRTTGDRHFLAWTLGTRGQMMLAWGLPWDAFAAYRQSEWADSTVAEFAGKADRLMSAMERPTSRAEADITGQ